jgi:predicted porin
MRRRDFLYGLPEPARSQHHDQRAYGVDGEYSLGHVVVRGEIVSSQWDTPFLNGDPTLRLKALGTSIEGRIALTPRWSFAARGDRLGFSDVTTSTGDVRTWDANVRRAEAGFGYLLRRNVRLKATYQYNWRDGGRIQKQGMAGAQLLYWF